MTGGPAGSKIETQVANDLAARIRERLGGYRPAERPNGSRSPKTPKRNARKSAGNPTAGGIKWQNLNVLQHRSHPKKNKKSKSPAAMRSWFAGKLGGVQDYDDDQLLQVFNKTDLDGNGTIEMDEFICAIKDMGIKSDIHTLTKKFKEMDIDGNGSIDYHEFRQAYKGMDLIKMYMDRTLSRAGMGTHKCGPRSVGKTARLQSEKAGIRPMKAADAAAAAGFDFAKQAPGGRPGQTSTKASLGGHSVHGDRYLSLYHEKTGFRPSAKKPTVRDCGFYSKSNLASERAGIKPMTWAMVKEDAANFTWKAAPGASKGKTIPSSSLRGHSVIQGRDAIGGGIMFNDYGRKPGLRELGFHDKVNLASVAYGIKPLKARDVAIEAADGFCKNKATRASLAGFSTTAGGMQGNGLRARGAATDHSHDPLGPEFKGKSVRKPTLRELGYFNHIRLASEKAGIKPLTAAEVAATADPHFERQAPGGRTGQRFTSSSLRGHSTTTAGASINSAYRTFSRGNRPRSSTVGSPGRPREVPESRANPIRGRPEIVALDGRPRSGSDGQVPRWDNGPARRKPRSPRTPQVLSTRNGFGRLASERAGIKPYTAMQAAEDAKDTSWSGKQSSMWVNQSVLSKSPKRKKKTPEEARRWLELKSASKAHKPVSDKELIGMFKRFDTDGNGYIELDEFQDAFRKLNVGLDQRQVMDVFREIDTDRSGAIDYAEFRAGYRAIDPELVNRLAMMREAGLGRKAGPREMGKSRKLASEMAGIRPARGESHNIRLAKHGARPVTASSLQGLSRDR